MGRPVRNTGYIGSSCIRVFDYNAASTGLTEAQCQQEGLAYETSYVLPKDRVALMPGSCPMHFKLIFEKPTGRVLGAQAISKGDAPKRVDVAAAVIKFGGTVDDLRDLELAVIKFGGTVDDLRDLELCYAPPFSTAKDPVNYAGLVACNLLDGAFRQVHVDQVRGLVESGACIIDVRPAAAYGGVGRLHHRRAPRGRLCPGPHHNGGEHPSGPAARPPGRDPQRPPGVYPLPDRPEQL